MHFVEARAQHQSSSELLTFKIIGGSRPSGLACYFECLSSPVERIDRRGARRVPLLRFAGNAAITTSVAP